VYHQNPGRKIGKSRYDRKVAVKPSEKKQSQYDAVLASMVPGKEYPAVFFCDVLHVKISRTKEILKELVDFEKIEIVGTYRNRQYKLKK